MRLPAHGLKLVGFTDAQPEAQSELQYEVLSSLVTEKLVTNDDLLQSTMKLEQDISALSAEHQHDFTELKQDINLIKKWVVGIEFAQVVFFSALKFLH